MLDGKLRREPRTAGKIRWMAFRETLMATLVSSCDLSAGKDFVELIFYPK